MNRLTSKKRIIELVEAFTKENLKDLNEAETRLRFINPFFESLGWNILDPKEVKIETATAKQTSTRPDYRFLINRNTKFFVEAKKPAVKLTDPNPIFQAKSYGFSAKVPLVILTDFEEFRPFKSIARPKLNLPLDGLIKEYDFKYIQYVDEFDKLYDTFSREAVSAGELEKKFTITKTENLATVDKEFLNDLSNWQEELAKNISLRNPKLNVPEINEAVQRILNRIIFIRICEDREIEDKEILLSYISNDGIYRNLLKEFRRMRAKYNGLLFNEHQLSENLSIDDKILKSIIKTLYPPNSPYRFDEIPIEILGTIYEQFLGKVITLTPTHRAKVEVKPEVRKAGGVFYTPQYIVKYIIKNTVGKMIENAKPSEIAKLRFADIACGSGSFLLEMFQVLIDHHIDYYSTHQEEIKKVNGVPDAYQDETGLWHLSTRKKKEILLNNIYGVDIDPQAVEVSTMSLYLKLLEGENAETFSKQLKLEMKETILPNLSNNIKCGNSLIGTDILDMNKDLFGSEIDLLKIRPFDWNTAFPEVMRPSSSSGGGFDAIVGNPPYEITLGKEGKEDVEYFKSVNSYIKQNYNTVKGEINFYKIFTEKAVILLKPKGFFGYIMPTSLLNDLSNLELRKHLFAKFETMEIDQFPEKAKVFKNVTQDVCIYIFYNSGRKILLRTEIIDPKSLEGEAIELSKKIIEQLDYKLPLVKDKREIKILSKLLELKKLKDFSKNISIFEGEIHLTKFKDALSNHSKTKDLIRLIRGDVIQRYVCLDKSEKLNFVHDKIVKNISSSLKLGHIKVKRLVYQQVVNIQKERRLNFYLLDEPAYVGNTCGYIIINTNDIQFTLKFLLGILNSKLLNWRFKLTSSNNHILTNELYQLPLKIIDFSNPNEKRIHDRMVELVDRMLELHKHKHQAKSDSEKELFAHQIKATDREIDELVYRLYEITEDERTLLERGSL